jgi:hypothetical protein
VRGRNVMFSTWIYVAVAAIIAAMAFILGHFVSGLGVAFVLLVSALWTTYSSHREKASSRSR